jgi:hypothetical protein
MLRTHVLHPLAKRSRSVVEVPVALTGVVVAIGDLYVSEHVDHSL